MRYIYTFLTIFLLQINFNSLSAKKNPTFEILDASIIDFEFFSGGEKLAVGKLDNIEIWEMQTKSKLFTLDNKSYYINQCIDISSDNRFLVAGTKDGKIILWDIESKKIVWEINTENLITDIQIAPDNLFIAAGSSNSEIYKINITDGSIVNTLNNHTLDITSLEFNESGTYLFSSSADKSIIIWNFQDGTMINQLWGHKNWVRDISLNPDETRLISCGDDERIIIWNINNIENCKAIDSKKTGLTWLTSVSYYKDGISYIFSNINGKVKLISNHGNSKGKFSKTILKIDFVPNKENKLEFILLFKGKGINIFGMDSFKTRY